jgi:hypothetical protein
MQIRVHCSWLGVVAASEGTVRNVEGRKQISKPTYIALNRGTDLHPSTIIKGWTRMRIEDDGDVSSPPKS